LAPIKRRRPSYLGFDPQVERLKSSLQEAEQARVKLLERAKRHVSTNHIVFLTRSKHQNKKEKHLGVIIRVFQDGPLNQVVLDGLPSLTANHPSDKPTEE